MPTTEERLDTLEAQVAQLLANQVTRAQFGEIGLQYDRSVAEQAEVNAGVEGRLDDLTRKISALGQGVAASDMATHTQGTASTSWVVNHNLGFQYPQPVFVNGSDEQITPTLITYTNANRLIADFAVAQSGVATIIKVS